MISVNGCFVDEDVLIRESGVHYSKLEKTFTHTVKLGEYYKTAVIVKRSRGTLIIPRFLAEKYCEIGVLRNLTRKVGTGVSVSFPTFALTPYPYQSTIVDHVMARYFTPERAAAGFGGVTLEVEAGLGKTFVAALIAARLGLKTLYVVPNEYLLEQAIDDFARCFPGIKVGKYYSRAKTDGDVVFIIINSVLSEKIQTPAGPISPIEYFKQFGLSIWDEVHEYATDKRSIAFGVAGTRFMLGITAEANTRADKMDRIVHYGVGPVCIAEEIPGFDVPDNERYTSRVNIISYFGPKEFTRNLTNDTGNMSAYLMSGQVIEDPNRMNLIVSEVRKLIPQHNIFIWCDMRSCVQKICDRLRAELRDCRVSDPENNEVGPSDSDSEAPRGLIPASLMGGATRAEIRIAQKSQIIVATYQYAYRGVSLPQFSAMIFATPRRAKIYQTLKRIFRMCGDTSLPRQIVDIVDARTRLRNQLPDRVEQYNRELFGMTIDRTTVKWEDYKD